MKTIFRPSFVEPDVLLTLGYKLISDDGTYLKYESSKGAVKRKGRTHEQLVWEGQRVIYFNCEFCPQDELVFCQLEDDGGTRKSYGGVIRSLEELNFILDSAE